LPKPIPNPKLLSLNIRTFAFYPLPCIVEFGNGLTKSRLHNNYSLDRDCTHSAKYDRTYTRYPISLLIIKA